MTKPISPDEVGQVQRDNIPPEVFEVVNKLIATKWSGSSATIKQEEILEALAEFGIWRDYAFDRGYLNFEEAYRAQGWKVEYDKPGYNESYGAFFVFKRAGR